MLWKAFSTLFCNLQISGSSSSQTTRESTAPLTNNSNQESRLVFVLQDIQPLSFAKHGSTTPRQSHSRRISNASAVPPYQLRTLSAKTQTMHTSYFMPLSPKDAYTERFLALGLPSSSSQTCSVLLTASSSRPVCTLHCSTSLETAENSLQHSLALGISAFSY